jgi:hypothetical protein
MGFTGGFSFGRCNPLLAKSFAVALLKAPFCQQKRGFKAKKRVKNASLLHDYGLLDWSDPKASHFFLSTNCINEFYFIE